MDTKPVELTTGHGNLPMLKIHTPKSVAKIYLHGAHIAHFQKNGEPPLLFLSRQGKFEAGKAIRGGVPIFVIHGSGRARRSRRTDWHGC